MEKVTTKQLPDEEVKNQVIKSLIKLRRKFGSAYELSQAVKKFGLFNGVVEYCDDGYDFRPFYDDETPYVGAYAEEGWAFPTFGCINDGKFWMCKLGFGIHKVNLTFNNKTGAIVKIVPDNTNSQLCWDNNTIRGRIAEIRALLEE